MSLIYLTQKDTKPRLNFTITVGETDTPLVLTGCTVKFNFRKLGSDTNVFSRACGIVEEERILGKCYYDWQSGDLNEAGNYVGELEVTFETGEKQTTNLMSFNVKPEFA